MRMANIVRAAALGVIYVVTARAGLSLDALHGFAAAVWPSTGIALAALVLYGTCLWPGIAVGAFLVNWSIGQKPTAEELLKDADAAEEEAGAAAAAGEEARAAEGA